MVAVHPECFGNSVFVDNNIVILYGRQVLIFVYKKKTTTKIRFFVYVCVRLYLKTVAIYDISFVVRRICYRNKPLRFNQHDFSVDYFRLSCGNAP